jgi:hypothetical protein
MDHRERRARSGYCVIMESGMEDDVQAIKNKRLRNGHIGFATTDSDSLNPNSSDQTGGRKTKF